MSATVEVVVTYLELAGDVRDPGQGLPPGLELHREQPPAAAGMAARMYREVGAKWHWTDRRSWSDADWRAEVHRDGVELWTVRLSGITVGYFELHVEGEAVDIRYFGLLPEYTGRGIGGPLLAAAMRRARSLGSGRMTVNTCTLDHPAALPNYLARGFHVVRTETQRRTLPA